MKTGKEVPWVGVASGCNTGGRTSQYDIQWDT